MEKRNRKIQKTVLPVSAPKKFTWDQWNFQNQLRCKFSNILQESTDKLVSEIENIQDFTSETIRNNKEETEHLLREKLEDIEFRRKELQRIRSEIVSELDALMVYKNRITNCLDSIRINAYDICKKCLSLRELRIGVDLVVDQVEVELKKECDLIEQSEKVLKAILASTEEQIRKLKSRIYFLDADLEKKNCNFCIDECNLGLKDAESSIYWKKYEFQPSKMSLKEWERQSNKTISDAFKELNETKPLRNYIDLALMKTIANLDQQKGRTNIAFSRRIQETKAAKEKLENQLSEVMKRMTEMNRNIWNLQKSLAEKEGYMALTRTRLMNRHRRPETELTRDSVETSLMKEASDLDAVVCKLQETLFEAEASLRYLLRSQMQIQEDINIKSNTLKIDEVDCTTLRLGIEYRTC